MQHESNPHIALVLSGALLTAFLGSCNSGRHTQTDTSESAAAAPRERSLEGNDVVPAAPRPVLAARRVDGKPERPKVDWEALYKSVLRQQGVDDFGTESLTRLMDNENVSVRAFSARLLGYYKERSAIPRLEKALQDESFYVVLGATEALLKMDNRKGVPVLLEVCRRACEDSRRDSFEDAVHMSDATRALARAGEVSAIPYLRRLLAHTSWPLRLAAVRSLGQLSEKDPSVLTDLAAMRDDEQTQVRQKATELLEKAQQAEK